MKEDVPILVVLLVGLCFLLGFLLGVIKDLLGVIQEQSQKHELEMARIKLAMAQYQQVEGGTK